MKAEETSERVIVGITQGDINGIGYEIIMKTLAESRILEMCVPVVYGSPKVSAYHRKAIDVANFSFHTINDISAIDDKKANLINCLDDNVRVELGKSTEMAGEASFLSLEAATKDLVDGKIDVLVTAPINKHNIQMPGFQFPGHTEYLESKCTNGEKSMMLMVSDSVRIGILCGHMPLKDVSAYITQDRLLQKLRILNQSLLSDFKIRGPRIAVLSLNPHAGDNGLLGTEEQDIIIPALRKANDEGIIALGPYPADGFFGSGQFKKFDAVLAMYHDQGMIPFKTLVFEEGVNYTAGLPFIRTSPAHGVAYELAGKNEASADSFRQALYLAIDVYNNRKFYKQITANPLAKYDID